MSVIFGLSWDYEEAIPYPPAPDEIYIIRPLTDEMIQDWTKKTTHKGWKNHVQVEERDDDRYNALLCEQIFAGWRGAVYLTVEDARAKRTSDCNLTNKIKFAGTQAERFNWIVTIARDLGARVAQEIEAQREAFANRLKHQLDFPQLNCSTCRESYEEGELADADGKLIYQGGCDVADFCCAECPDVLYGEMDEHSQLGRAIWGLICESLVPDQPPPLQFYFDLMGIKVGSPESREIYQRLLAIKRIMDEHKRLTEGDPEDRPGADGDDNR